MMLHKLVLTNRRVVVPFFFLNQHLYSATSKLVLRRREPQWGPMSEVCLQEAYG